MQIIVTHDHSDFDAFASQVAAQKLYPGARIVLAPRLGRHVRDFLALHRDRFPTIRARDIDAAEVTRMIVVDVRNRRRIRDLDAVLARLDARDPGLDVHIYDHHPASMHDLEGALEVVEPVGSATTLLIERLRPQTILDPIEATLLALGIYTDTGALTYAGTTGRDAAAVAWLLDQGASLKMVNRYLNNPFNDAQRGVLSQLLGNVEVVSLSGVAIGFGVVELPRAVGGLAQVATQVLDLEGHDALFAIFVLRGKKIQVIARSRVAFIDVAAALSTLGGGGHPGAAAATVKNTSDAAEVQRAILTALAASPPTPRCVRDVMSSPVQTVAPDTPLRDVSASLRTWRHTGMPVLRDGVLVGIISRRDIEAAERGGRAHLAVSSCMAQPPRTTSPDVPLEAALEKMVAHNIGRLPVLERGRLIGIISRSDLLRVLYKERRSDDDE